MVWWTDTVRRTGVVGLGEKLLLLFSIRTRALVEMTHMCLSFRCWLTDSQMWPSWAATGAPFLAESHPLPLWQKITSLSNLQSGEEQRLGREETVSSQSLGTSWLFWPWLSRCIISHFPEQMLCNGSILSLSTLRLSLWKVQRPVLKGTFAGPDFLF